MDGRTRSENKRISAFVEKTKNDCVVYQIYHDTEICAEIHDLEELWQRELFLKKGRISYNLEQFQTETLEEWRTGKLEPYMTPLHISDLQNNYPTIARVIKRGDIIEDCEEDGERQLAFISMMALISFIGIVPLTHMEVFLKCLKQLVSFHQIIGINRSMW